MATRFSQEKVEIVKRYSIIDTNQGYFDPLREAVLKEKNPKVAEALAPGDKMDKGYQYFTNEDITLAEAYVLVHKFMISNGEEPSITQNAIDYIDSMYSLDFGGQFANRYIA